MDPSTQATVGSITELLKFGIAGVFIIVLIIAVVVLYKSKEKQAEERLTDMRKCTEALVGAALSMGKSAEEVAEIRTVLTSLVAELQARRGR